jgi:YD repeat-containing protein
MQYAEEMSDGSAALVGGVARHRLDYAVCVLADTDSGRMTRVSPFARWRFSMSRSGKRAAWLQPYPSAILKESLSVGRPNRILDYRLVSVSLADGKVENASIEVKGYPVGLELSADGSRVAVMAGEIVTVFDLASGRNLGSARIPSELGVWSAALTFVTPDVIRVYTRENTRGKANTRGTFLRLGAYEFALRQRTLKRLLDVERPGNWQDLDVSSPNGTRLLQRVIRSGPPVEGSSVALIMYDLTSGKPLFEIDSNASERIRSSRLLGDGRVAAIATRGEHTMAQLYDGSGTRVRELDLGRTTTVRIIDEVAPGVLAIAQAASAGSSYRPATGWTLTRVDLNDGSTAPIASGLAPLPRDLYKARSSPAASGPIVHPMWDEAGHLVAVDLRTGSRKKLIDA